MSVKVGSKPSRNCWSEYCLPDHAFAQIRKQDVPVRIAAVQLSQFVLNLHVGGIGSKAALPRSGRDRVNCPANWSVTARVFRMSWNAAIFNSGRSKPFAEHVHAHHDPRLSRQDLFADRFALAHRLYAGMQLDGLGPDTALYLEDFLRPRDASHGP